MSFENDWTEIGQVQPGRIITTYFDSGIPEDSSPLIEIDLVDGSAEVFL